MDYDGEASQFPDASRFSFQQVLHPKPQYTFSQVKQKNFSLHGSKIHKGLRNLSFRVKKIIESESQTTYRCVAEKLIAEDNNKDEQNVKRRVYDALNVLIAAGVILKRKKFLVATDETFKSGKCHNKEKWLKIKEDQEIRDRKKELIKQKKDYLFTVAKKLIKMKYLATRNNNNKSLPNSQNAAETFIREPSQQQQQQQFQLSQQSVYSQDQSQNKQFHFPILAFWCAPDKVQLQTKSAKDLCIQSRESIGFLNEEECLQNIDDRANVSKTFDDKRFVNYYLKQ